MLQPARLKYRKQFRGTRRGPAKGGTNVDFGEFGLKAMDSGWFSAAQIEAVRKTIAHHTQRGGKIWIRIFPDKPITGKAAGTRMGSGKGDLSGYVAVVKPGRILFEVAGIDRSTAREAFRLAAAKIPFATKFVEKS
jgi:large subunit ribosomal protein L16